MDFNLLRVFAGLEVAEFGVEELSDGKGRLGLNIFGFLILLLGVVGADLECPLHWRLEPPWS